MRRFGLFVFLSVLLAGCGQAPPVAGHSEGAHEEEHADGAVKLSPEAEQIAGIETSVVERRDIQASLQVPGTVESTSQRRAVVTPPIAGRVVSIGVQLGDKVAAGQSLAVLESPELAQCWSSIAEAARLQDAARAELQEAKSEVSLAAAKLNAARSNRSRQQDLARAGAFSQAPLQQAQSDVNDAQSEHLSIQKEQASHAEQLRRLENLFRDGIVSKSELEAARLELQQDQIRLDRTRAKIENAKATLDRERNIASRGLLNAKELQAADNDVRSSELELERARIRVRSSESALINASTGVANARAVYRSNSGATAASVGRVELTAPIAGTVTHLDITKGQAVDRTQVLLEIENLEAVWVTASIPEQDADKVRKGAAVRVTVASLPGRDFSGVVQIVGSRVMPKTRSVPAQCLVSGAAGMLKPGMFATVHLRTGAKLRQIVVPKSAILTDGRKSYVFVREAEGFARKEVELGSQDGDRVAIVSSLNAGDRVATKGVFTLSSEQKKDELKGHED